MMRSVGVASVAIAAVAAPVIAAAPASAQPDPLRSAVTLTNTGACVGHVAFDTVFGTDTPYFGLISNLIGVGPCSVDVFVNWRNADTGATGTVKQPIYGPGGGGSQITFDPGRGHITGTITTSATHWPGSFDFQRN